MTVHRLLQDRSVLADVAALTPESDRVDHAAVAASAIWSSLVEPGDSSAGRLRAALGAAAALEAVATDDREAAASAGLEAAVWEAARERWLPRTQPDAIRWALHSSRAAGLRLIAPGHSAWPAGLDDLADHAPACLWVRGDPAALIGSEGGLAVVGARAATSYGESTAWDIAGDVASQQVPIVSGAAYGIDGVAHRAALAAGGRTIAILAGGVDRPYPNGHADLLARVARSSAVVAEVPFGAAPTRWRFLQRNRLIAAMTAATLVVEAGSRSGSLNTAGHAAHLGRALGAVPGPVTSATSAGCHRLLREYAAQCITGPEEALELLGRSDAPTLFDLPGDRPAETTRVLDALSRRTPRDAADIARRCGMAVAGVRAQLALLEIEGAVRAEGGRWRRLG